ncbi:rhodanese-like domain-containing protein [Spartinivicinus poritis]|uniref:Rhodanese-like domain-containing protein n=1 Tax=Spartinivicinus poritis TaxID=2994640 RepID=A0ABT5UHF2_9GAMM|nr:rhodanese-like domain-containing protein [Spartinivicinus sp. A2-2]MDE1464863.1 rhodanese-like domain-containing protein [Spartinivicinus sp. A2-2]
MSSVSRLPAAPSDQTLAHFQNLLRYETDCWDVHHAITNQQQDFVLLDVRGEEAFKQGHIEGAINLPYWKIKPDTVDQYPKDTLFVVYCAGPHCNATEKAAIRLAELNCPVKKMIGGICGWIDEGFALTS